MTTMLKLVVIATLLLAAGSGAVPAGANEVIVPETVSFGGLPLDPRLAGLLAARRSRLRCAPCLVALAGKPQNAITNTPQIL